MQGAAQRKSCPPWRCLGTFHVLRTFGSHPADADQNSDEYHGQRRRSFAICRAFHVAPLSVHALMGSFGQSAGDRPDERGRLVARLLRPALAEQRRICLFACEDFPREDDCLGRDLTQLTIVQSNAERADALRNHFGQMIVVEAEEMDAFLARQLQLDEGFDLIIVPELQNDLADAPLIRTIAALAGCLRPGGRVALIAPLPKASSAERSFAEFLKLVESTARDLQLSSQKSCGYMLLTLSSKS